MRSAGEPRTAPDDLPTRAEVDRLWDIARRAGAGGKASIGLGFLEAALDAEMKLLDAEKAKNSSALADYVL